MDFIHLFADHSDTKHNDQTGLVIEKQHHHCAFLSLTLTSFANDYSVPVLSFYPSEYFTRHAAITSKYIQRSIVAVSLRGPPTL
jgi:hypothetical protein